MSNRQPDQISGDMVLCKDSTIWKYNGSYWDKLPPIPNDEEYESQQKGRKIWRDLEIKRMEERIQSFGKNK